MRHELKHGIHSCLFIIQLEVYIRFIYHIGFLYCVRFLVLVCLVYSQPVLSCTIFYYMMLTLKNTLDF